MLVERGGQRRALGRCTLLVVALSGIATPAQAGSMDFDNGIHLDYKLTAGYALAVRTEDRADGLINGGVVPLQLAQNISTPPPPAVQNPFYPNGYDCPFDSSGALTKCIRFLGTGLNRMANFDDGDRNFKPGSLVNNRASLLGEFNLTYHNYGWVFSANGFYDNVYNQPNANNSPDTVNHTGEWNEYTEGTRHYDGRRARFLENYIYGDWKLPLGMSADLRVGKQLATWGESLFFGGIASAQAPNDAAKAFVPGAEVKDILLPVYQIAGQLQATDKLTFLAQYKLQYKGTELFPVGDFYSTQDELGPGGEFAYGSINPLYLHSCPFADNSGNVTDPCAALYANAALKPIIDQLDAHYDIPPYILAPRGPDIKPSDFGQWGVGAKYQVTTETSVGLYYLRYDDTNPAGVQTYGFSQFVPGGCLYPFPLPPGQKCILVGDTSLLGQKTPINYQAKYFEGIHMVGSSFSTTLWDFNVAGELNYRQGQDMPIQSLNANVLTPYYTTGKLGQALLSFIYAAGPSFLWDDNNIVSEFGYTRVLGVDPVPYVPGSGNLLIQSNGVSCNAQPTCSGNDLFFSRNTWGFEILSTPTKHNVISGWDLSMPIEFLAIMKGNPEVAGLFGPLLGEGDQRGTVGVNMTRLGNLEVGLAYNMFLGRSDTYVHNSFFAEHPLTDRDNVAFHIKYAF
jgi:hypothetical protein